MSKQRRRYGMPDETNVGSMRYDAKRDANEPEIETILKLAGATVCKITGLKGFPDLVVGYNNKTFLLEVKMPDGELNQNQRDFIRDWQGDKIYVVQTMQEALDAIGSPLEITIGTL